MTRRQPSAREKAATKRRPATEPTWPRPHPPDDRDSRDTPRSPPAAQASARGQAAVALGYRIQQHRLAAEMTQGDLARRTALSRSYVSQLERGEANITLDKLERIARVIGWDLAKTLSIHQPLTLNDSARKLLHTQLTQLARQIDEMVRSLDALDPTQGPLNLTAPRAATSGGRQAPRARARPRGRP